MEMIYESRIFSRGVMQNLNQLYWQRLSSKEIKFCSENMVAEKPVGLKFQNNIRYLALVLLKKCFLNSHFPLSHPVFFILLLFSIILNPCNVNSHWTPGCFSTHSHTTTKPIYFYRNLMYTNTYKQTKYFSCLAMLYIYLCRQT